MRKRYIVTLPVNGGYQYFDVVDTHEPGNFIVATFSNRISVASMEARRLCEWLNEREADRNAADETCMDSEGL
jgi:hypothetical protein